ncbi:Nramp family divalent metal transporter [Fulvimarina sp. MAC3]|uniref:Nramp family divalent metal transporter n=1 Tax=Fulvimarina sp. MAC3 TaxID=3148887 RepID=UPI0031FE1552
MLERLKSMGPGLLVAAAFIGPGTVTTASVAGAETGFALLWALVFAIVATIVLQEMSARLGIVSRKGLGEALRGAFENRFAKLAIVGLVILAIGFGTAAFQTGNVTGAALGMESVTGLSNRIWALLVGAAAFGLLASGIYKLIERVLVVLVVVMSIVFLVTAIMVGPDLGAMAAGLVPSIPSGSALTTIGLIGTTVVTYNFFLHASSVQDRWGKSIETGKALGESRFDTVASIVLGGFITLAILVTAAAAFHGSGTSIESAGQMAEQLEPLLGSYAKWLFALGLFAAGMTSSVTAPLAAAYAVSGVLGWSSSLKDMRFRAVWTVVILVGTAFAFFGTSPVRAILVAQAANGLLLPLVALFLLLVMNRKALLGRYVNGPVGNGFAVLVLLLSTFLGAYTLLNVFGVIG